ncbi:MAG TPA: apolipoprotein N-acyltransferase [Pyrinomonadaceae bacterium]|nr:apolipoprotein N-acyltransferase [Pyrinomonadaceae bacterium]
MTRIDFRNYEWGAAAASALLLILAFPNFEYYQLAWIGLVPLLVVIGRRPSPLRAFILGWAAGSVFFYVTCYWLTYSMIHYGGLPTALAYLLLIPGALVIGIFHGLFAALIALAIQKWGRMAVLMAPIFWTALEWVRLVVTGQLWNALGYSQAYHNQIIEPATWGGVYAVSFLLVAINSAVALLIIHRKPLSIALALLIPFAVLAVIRGSLPDSLKDRITYPEHMVKIVAVQPNVPMNPVKTTDETKALIERHITLSTKGLAEPTRAQGPRLVIWPESPMNFTYASNKTFREFVAGFTKENHTSLLFNSLEPAPNDGSYNSALLVNEEGRLISQYDKIRLMPFGEYVPLPQWLPGSSLISGIVGEFTPGSNYTLMPIADRKAGVFICIESAYPWIARRLAHDGADVLINISNDGYLGPTAVMRQHLANAIFRAMENGRPVLRVTNSGLSAYISEDGHVYGLTEPFQADVRVWTNNRGEARNTFYTRHGDLFVYVCAVITLIAFVLTNYGRFINSGTTH